MHTVLCGVWKERQDIAYVHNTPWKGNLEVKLRCFDTGFQTPYRYFSVDVKVILYPCKIAIKSLPLTDFGFKFVKIDNWYYHENDKQKPWN